MLWEATKIILIGVAAYEITLYLFGGIPSFLSAISGIGGYLFNLKGLNKKRITIRTINLGIIFSLAVFIPYIAKENTIALVVCTFIFTGITAFFSLEEYLGGFLAHIPTMYIYVYSFFNKGSNDYLKSLVGVLIGLLVSYLYFLIFFKSNSNDRMEQAVEEYLDSIIKEVRSYRNGKDIQKTREEGREIYKIFLNEFHKTSYGAYLGEEKGKKCFEFVLSLHQLIEKFRIEKKEHFTCDRYLEFETFFRDIKNNKDIDLKTLNLPLNTARVILKNRKKLFEKEENEFKEKYKKNYKRLSYLKENLSLNTTRMRHAIQLAITFTIGIFIFQKFGMVKSVWLPTAMVIVAQPYGLDSKKKIGNRVVGTVFGLLLASIIVLAVPSIKVRLIIAIFSLYISFCLRRFTYVMVVMFATVRVVLMSLVYLSPENSFVHRMLYIIMSGTIVLIVEFILKDRSRITIKKRLIRIVENDSVFLDEMIELLGNKKKKHLDEYIVKGYILREIIIKDLENAGEENSKMILKDSLVFMDKLKLIYSRIRSNDMDVKYVEVLILINDFIKSSIVFIKTENAEGILEYNDKIKKLLDHSIDDTMIVEILELIEYYIENFNNKNYFWKKVVK